jgi:hypothetical protein
MATAPAEKIAALLSGFSWQAVPGSPTTINRFVSENVVCPGLSPFALR